MGRYDEARMTLEAATGGKNTLLIDDLGYPSVMVRIPKFKWSDVMEGGEDKTCSAFIVGGKEKDCIYISKFLNIIEQGRAYSLPGGDPAHNLSIDEARAACARKGPGWHLMSNAEWMAIAHWCKKNGRMPHGNNNFGRDHKFTHEHAVMSPNNSSKFTPEGRTLTGTGLDTWSHDGTNAGIFDLNGNVWDFVSGLRLKDGEIHIIPDNDSALNVDEGEQSSLWKAIDIRGNLVAPGSPDTYKYDGVNAGNDQETAAIIKGGVKLNTAVKNPHHTGKNAAGDYGYTIMPFREMKAETGVMPHLRLKELGLYPASEDLNENIFVRNNGERIALRGGSWFDGVIIPTEHVR
jgi:formylglycine-generating enzyme required for sulfatase activity